MIMKIENFYQEDLHFRELVQQYLPENLFAWADKELHEFGQLCAGEIDERATHTDREGQPRLIKYNRFGEDVSEIWVNEGYKKTVQQTYNKGIVGYIYKEIPELGTMGNYVYSFAQGYLLSQSEPGFYCPVTLTMATAYLLEHYADKDVKDRFLPHVLSTGEIELYEGATFLTERQGGSDVGANVVKAIKEGNEYRLYGEKYFASNSGMCGVTMVLARMENSQPGTKGLSLFAVPWRNEDGSDKLNGIQIRRLKDKLGVRAVPSAEIEFNGAKAYLVGDPSKGIHYMMEALNLSRVCNAVASIGIMRRAYVEGRNYAFHREAFGQKLSDYPMVKDTLTKLAVKQEVETSAVFYLVDLFDRVTNGQASDQQKVMTRLLIALLKKESAEQAIHFCHEAIELHGGNGYIEDFVLPRLLRDAQVLTVWEGTANILGLEILRLMKKFQVHQIFIEQMNTEVDNVLPECDELAHPIKLAIQKLEELTSFVVNASEETQTFHSKKIAELMVRIFESVISLKDIRNSNSRKRAVAEVFIRQTWEEDAWKDEEMKTVKYFDLIVSRIGQ